MIISYEHNFSAQRVFDHPGVREGHAYNGEIDTNLKPFFERGGFSVTGEGFAFVLDPVVNGVVEVHTSILPDYRGKSKEITLAAMGRVFIETPVIEIVTRVQDNKPAKYLARSVGMHKTFTRGDVEYFSIDISTWAAACKDYVKVGEDFHEFLESEGIETDHEDDSNHDQYVGIALEMARHQPFKAERFYNQWAHLAGFHPCQIVSLEPLSCWFGSAIIEIDEGIKVCQQLHS